MSGSAATAAHGSSNHLQSEAQTHRRPVEETTTGRRDGRSAGMQRELSATQGCLARADGSARVRAGLTDVIVAVHGAMDCSIPRQLLDRADVHVSFRHRASASGGTSASRISGATESAAANFIRDAVLHSVIASKYPRKAIAISAHVLYDDGSALAATLNACFLALLDAGVPMTRCVASSTVSVHQGDLVVDPSRVEEAEADAVLTFSFASSGNNSLGLVASCGQGDCGGASQLLSAVQTSERHAREVLGFFKSCAQQKLGTDDVIE